MKKSSFILLLLLLAAAWSCGKDDPVTPDPPVTPVTPDPPPPSTPTVKEVDYDKYDLKDLAARAGLKLGVSFTYSEYWNNSAVRDILKHDFAAVTFGNEMKQDAILQANGTYRFTMADEMVSWAKDCGTDLFGHTLGWHSQQQRTWLNSVVSAAARSNAASLLQDNWNFEKGTLEGYRANGFEAFTSLYDVFAGDWAAKATANGASLQFNVPAQAGKSYAVSFWAKTLSASQVESLVNVVSGEGQEASTPVGTSWMKYSVPMEAGAGGGLPLSLVASRDVVIDNIRVEAADGSVPPGGETGGGIDFETFAAGGSAQLTDSGLFVQVNGPGYVSVTDAQAHGGKLSLKMDNSSGYCKDSWDIQVVTKSFDVTPGTTYRIEWYGKASQAADLQIDLRGDGDVVYLSSVYEQFPKTGTDWTHQWVDYTVKQGTGLSVAFYGGVEAAVYYLDDIRIAPAPSAGMPRRKAAPSFKVSNGLAGELVNDAIGFVYRDWVYTMVSHFDVYGWDVVNETFTDWPVDFRNAGNTTGNVFVWGQYFKSTKDWVDKAFAYATDALARSGKSAVLYLNDYNLETIDPKRKAYCDYVKGNPQVTGVGSQMHLNMVTDKDLESKVVASLQDLTATGRMVRISELDIVCSDWEAQAALYRFIVQKYLEIVPAAQRGGLTIWGINDKDSWLGESSAPLLYRTGSYLRKPAYEALYLYFCELAGLDPYKEQ